LNLVRLLVITVTLTAFFPVAPVQAQVLPSPAVEVECELRLDYELSLLQCEQGSSFTDTRELFAQKQAEEADRVAKLKKARELRYLTVNSGISYGGTVEILDKGRPEYLNCVAYVRSVRYMPRTANGNAGSTPINSNSPQVGAIAVMRGHVAITESFTATTVTIVEGNYYHGYKTRRIVPRSVIKGYWI
jgi:hypothetical protein